MAILRKEKQTIIEFGTGDIRVSGGMIKGDAVIGFNTQEEPKKIGSQEPSIDTVETLPNSEVFIKFGSIKSLEMLILKLQEARSIVVNDEIAYDISEVKNITEIYEANSILKG